jgi:hypothetical protein
MLARRMKSPSQLGLSHAALCQHLTPDNRVLPLWSEFKEAKDPGPGSALPVPVATDQCRSSFGLIR